MSQYTINDSTSFSNRRNTLDAWDSDTVNDDRPQLLTWLSPLNPGLRHCDIQEHRVNDGGEWLIETEEFTKWYGLGRGGHGESAVLFCYGDPGVGKTFISSLVVDRLCDQASVQNTAVSCFYLDFAARKEQSAANVLGSLLKQILGGMKRIPEEILRVFRQQKTTIGGRRPQLVDIVRMLELVTSYQPTFVCLDALDECSRVQRARLLDSLQRILKKSSGTRIFATGRPYIQAEIKKRLAGQVTSVSISPNRGEITRFLRVRLDEDDTLDATDYSLEADILQKIPEKMSQTFRLVSLSIEAILREPTIYRRRERLSRTADGLGWGDAYGTTIERIIVLDGGKSRLGIETLMWISHAEQPLRVDVLCYALAVELGSKDFNTGNAPSLLTLVSCCQGLITVDEETSTVRLIHPTLQEYLLSRLDLFNRPHSAMAEICLTFLNSKLVKALSANCMLWKTPFLNYSSRYWGAHAKRDLSGSTKSLALELFREYDSHISAGFLISEADSPGSWTSPTRSGARFSGLHCASFFGIVELVTALVEIDSHYINGKDSLGYTPLTWAARNGHGGVVRVLLGRGGASPDMTDDRCRTPLSYAAQYGHEDVAKILLEREEVSPNMTDNGGRTPLSYAAQYGHEDVAKILLRHIEVCPNMEDNRGRTLLSYAAQGGNEQVISILLARQTVNPDEPYNYGRTPLSYAAGDGRAGVVKMLLARQEVNPDKEDREGRTPLSHASQGGHEGVAKILLARQEVNPAEPNCIGQTPLSYAAEYGSEGVVKLLLGRKEVDPDKPDELGMTPLSRAASAGREEVVKLLLEQIEVKPDKPDELGMTPLSRAAFGGHEGVVKTLLARQEVDPDWPAVFPTVPSGLQGPGVQ